MNQTAREQIQRRAYELWEKRGRPWGTPQQDWFAAEDELQEPDTLINVAREVGTAIGKVVVFLQGA